MTHVWPPERAGLHRVLAALVEDAYARTWILRDPPPKLGTELNRHYVYQAAADAHEACGSMPALWEAMAARGVLPEDWVQNPRRRFDALDPATAPPAGCPRLATHCLAFAADVPRVLAAEELGRQLWSCDDVLWCVVSREAGLDAKWEHVRRPDGHDHMLQLAFRRAWPDPSGPEAGRLVSRGAVTAAHRRVHESLHVLGYACVGTRDGRVVLLCPDL